MATTSTIKPGRFGDNTETQLHLAPRRGRERACLASRSPATSRAF